MSRYTDYAPFTWECEVPVIQIIRVLCRILTVPFQIIHILHGNLSVLSQLIYVLNGNLTDYTCFAWASECPVTDYTHFACESEPRNCLPVLRAQPPRSIPLFCSLWSPF